MKNIKFILLTVGIAIIFAGCGIKKMVTKYPEVSIILENADLDNVGGKVDYSVKGTIPPKYMNKKAKVELEVPYLIYDNESGISKVVALDKITLVGEKSKESGVKIPYKTGGDFAKKGSFNYKDEYANADIDVVSTISKGKKAQKMSPRKLGEGITNSASLAKLFPEIKNADENGAITGNGTWLINANSQYKEEFIENKGVIYYDVNLYNLNWNFKLNKDQSAKDQLKALVDLINNNTIIDKVIITGWASPEGEESKNQGLSEKRFEQGKKWFSEQYEKYLKDFAKQNKIKWKDMVKPELVFENHANGEDWSGFEVAIEKSSIVEKNQILNVVRSQSNSQLREQKIREMTDIYNEIKDIVLPPLRRSEIVIRTNKNKYNDTQILEYVVSKPELLSLNEKLYAATILTDNIETKKAIYKAIIADDANQKDWRAYNNLAVIQITDFLKNKDLPSLEAGASSLEKAKAISPNGIVLNNCAIISCLKGDIMGAKKDFEAAAKANLYPVNQDYNLAMYDIFNGNYAQAEKMMSSKHCDYNVALNQLVSKNYTGAKETLNCIKNQTAEVYYLKAVLGARTKNQTEVLSNLREAIKLDSSYAKKALKDPEFKNFRNNNEFSSIVK